MVKKTIPQKVKNEVKEYIDVLRADKLPITKAIVFGSYAKGTQHKWSDIDLCIISPKFKNAFNAMQYLWSKRIKDSGLTIEPVGFSPKDFKDDTSLTYEIKQTGVELKI
ncbi:nucleotidyltransferase domain-containing protein [Patescibacteria group bacterium AH-259-L07]|nr:nucleotidyltransferase domain-containing protein [Patescibacteria group bacterium AH-259-L07]